MPFRYEITPRPVDLGDGWRLRLLEDCEEVGGGVFPVAKDDPQQGVTWWNQLIEQVRAEWLAVATSAVTADAWLAYLRAAAYTDAEGADYAWLDSRVA